MSRTSRRIARRTSRSLKANVGGGQKVSTIPVGVRVVRKLGGKVVMRGVVVGHKQKADNRGRSKPAVMILEDGSDYPYPYLDGEGIALEKNPSGGGWVESFDVNRRFSVVIYENAAERQPFEARLMDRGEVVDVMFYDTLEDARDGARMIARSFSVEANGGRRTSQRGGSDIRRIEEMARAAGWSVDRTERGHLVFRSPDKTIPPLFTSSIEGDPRTLKNIEALLRRHGLETRSSRVKRNPLKPSDKRLLKKLEEECGPAGEWGGRCTEIAHHASKLVGHPDVYGHYRGPVHAGGFWGSRKAHPFIQHGWVKLPRGRVLDPTRFSFEHRDPYIYVGAERPEYDEGGQVWRASTIGARPPPKRGEGQDRHFTLWPGSEAARAIELIFGSSEVDLHDVNGSVTLSQLQAFYLANMSYEVLQPYTRAIYDALNRAGIKSFIPLDNWRRAEREEGRRR